MKRFTVNQKRFLITFTILLTNIAKSTRSMTTTGAKRKISKGSTGTPSSSRLSPKKENNNYSTRKSSTSKNEVVMQPVMQSPRTVSFEPISDFTFHQDSKIKIHTLLLGTHPSIQSLAKGRYYGHPLNTFWWIAGDNLGFRRDTGISPSTGKEYQLTKDLLYSTDHIIPYEEQLKTITSYGFALWDVLQSCNRKGSLDNDIKNEIPNDIRGFCNKHPSIKRIVLCNGSSSAVFFNRHFKDWWLSDELKMGTNKESIQAFQKFEKMLMKSNVVRKSDEDKIECVCGIGVSPAAAKYTYTQKRDFYKEFCYDPGLEDHHNLNVK